MRMTEWFLAELESEAAKSGPSQRPAPLHTSAELVAALDKAVATAREALRSTTDDRLPMIGASDDLVRKCWKPQG